MTDQLIRPKQCRFKIEKGSKPIDWATSTRYAMDVCKYGSRRISPESVSHAEQYGDPDVANSLGKEYSMWVATCQVQQLSHWTESAKEMRPYIGAGIPYKIARLPIVRKMPPDYMYGDAALMLLFAIHNRFEAVYFAEQRNHEVTVAGLRKQLSRMHIDGELAFPQCVKATSLRGWCSYCHNLTGPRLERVLGKLKEGIEIRTKEVARIDNDSYRQWVATALEKGAGGGT